MNRQITRVAVASLVLLVGLIVGVTYWQTWAAAGLADRQDNSLQRVAQFSIARGRIFASDGRSLLAGNTPKVVDGRTLYFRYYPTLGLAAQVVGYSTPERARAGLERSQNDFLTASNSNLQTVFDRALADLQGKTIKGNDIVTTIDLNAQRVALQALKGQCGAAVALDPRTGKVLVMASNPTYNPNVIDSAYTQIVNAKASCGAAAALVNRATAGLYPPGSTFKIVTTTAALDTGAYKPWSRFVDKGFCIEYGKQVKNFGDQNGPEKFGNVNLTQALQNSINAVYCSIGKALGAKTLLDYARRFGFYSPPPLETPQSERLPSGLYSKGRPYVPKQPQFDVDPGRLAFGQERLLTTPEQMAMVAAAVANGGVIMRPYVVDRIVAPNGSVVFKTSPHVYARPMKPETAAQLTAMMEAVVRAGTGGNAQIPGITVAGKTGTAETSVPGRNDAWFIAFAPAEAPTVAVAVALENQTATGGAVAAPIAKAIMESLLSKASP